MTRLSGCGFCAVLLAETAVTMAAAHYSLIDALYTVTNVTVTVGLKRPGSVGASRISRAIQPARRRAWPIHDRQHLPVETRPVFGE
jgi:hypothetical protein